MLNRFQKRSINQTAKTMNVSYMAIGRAIEKLEKLEIVNETSGSKRNRIYCAKAILDILEEPTGMFF